VSAAQNGDSGVIRHLVEHGIDVNEKGVHLLRFALRSTDIVISDEDGDTALMLATRNGHLDVVKYFIEHGADINAKGE
jgi:ankyrin repeat protein